MFFSTIASQLTRVIQGLDLLIAKLLDGEHGRYAVAPEYQFGDLIAAPLQTLSQTNPSSGTTIVIVVDALDECVEYQARKVVELLARLDQYPPFKIKTLLTSRPIEAIRSEFLRMEPSRLRRLALEDTSQDVLEGDISLFIHERLKDIRSRHERLGNDWPGQDKINELIIRSVPLFLYANTVCAFIDDDKVTPEEQLRVVLDESSGPQLAMTYLPILKAFTKGYSGTRLSKTQETLRNIIGPVVLAAEPLPLDLVLKLSALEDHNQLRARLTSLQSVLFISRTNTCDQAFVRPFHLTFRDFLVDPEEEHDFQIDQCSTHKHIAATCLEIMKAPGSLRQDICAQKVTGVKRLDVEAFVVNKHIKAHLAYACNHWAHHLEMSGSSLDDTHEALDFLRNNFLYWFEAMSWLGNASAMIRTIQALQMLTKREGSIALLPFLEDAHSFALGFHFIADLAPLQLYASALAFAPQGSLVKAAFQHCLPSWLLQPPVTAQTWRTDALRIEAHGHFTAMEFSPDDRYIATCSDDGTTRIWDSNTGVCLSTSKALQEHKSSQALAFSSCNSLAVASASKRGGKDPGAAQTFKILISRTIELRDIAEVTCTALPGYMEKVAFSPDDHDVLYAAISRQTGGTWTLDMWRFVIGAGTSDCIWSRTMDDHFVVLGISAEVGLVACCLDNNDLDIADLHSGTSRRQFNMMTIPGGLYSRDFCAVHGENLIIAESIRGKKHPPHCLHKFSMQTGVRQSFYNSAEFCHTFAIAHRGDRLIWAPSGGMFVEVRSMSVPQEIAVNTLPQRDSLVDLSLSCNGEMLLVAYPDRIEVQTLRGDIIFTRPVIWSTGEVGYLYAPRISSSQDGAFIAARTCTDTGANGITLWHIATGKEVHRPCNSHGWLAPVFSHSTGVLAYEDDDRRRLVVWDILGDIGTRTFNVPWRISRSMDEIQFSPDDKTLLTRAGYIRIADESEVWIDEAISMYLPNRSTSRIHYREGWVMYDRQDQIWVPPYYRPNVRRAQKDTYSFSFGTASGTVALWNTDSLVVMRISDPSES